MKKFTETLIAGAFIIDNWLPHPSSENHMNGVIAICQKYEQGEFETWDAFYNLLTSWEVKCNEKVR
jgi:hypothetical protein